MSVLIEKLNATFMAVTSWYICKFLQKFLLLCIFYICQEILIRRIRWWGQRQINGDSIKMFIINTWEWSLCPTFSSCIKQGEKNWCNPKEVILVLLGGIPLHIMYTQNVDSMVCTSAPQNFICSTLNRTLLLPLVRFVLMWDKTKIMKLQILKLFDASEVV